MQSGALEILKYMVTHTVHDSLQLLMCGAPPHEICKTNVKMCAGNILLTESYCSTSGITMLTSAHIYI